MPSVDGGDSPIAEEVLSTGQSAAFDPNTLDGSKKESVNAGDEQKEEPANVEKESPSSEDALSLNQSCTFDTDDPDD
jgi:hypothetical protein